MKNYRKYIPHALLLIYAFVFIFCAINPFDRDVWYAENLPIFLLVSAIVYLYIKNIRFSYLSYILMSILPLIHTVGGYYTFELVPFDWFNNFFGFERNMYDRVGHFSVGLYAFPIVEYFLRHKLVNRSWIAYAFALFTISFVAMSYELIEWYYAATEGGTAGAAFLGSQGDIWDAQKDMLMDTLGGVFVLVIFYFRNKLKHLSN